MKAKKIQSVLLTLLCTVFVMCMFAVPSYAASLTKITKLKSSVTDTTVTLSWEKKGLLHESVTAPFHIKKHRL